MERVFRKNQNGLLQLVVQYSAPSHIHSRVQFYVTQVSTQVSTCDLKIVTSRLFYIDRI